MRRTETAAGVVVVEFGTQRGDEGKGATAVRLLESGFDGRQYSGTARFNGGPNAGHRIDEGLTLFQVPEGVIAGTPENYIGRGSLVDACALMDEINKLNADGFDASPKRLKISSRATVISPLHILNDTLNEGGDLKQGSTKAGIAFAASDKYGRRGVQLRWLTEKPQELLEIIEADYEKCNQIMTEVDPDFVTLDPGDEAAKWLEKALGLKGYITDTTLEVKERLGEGAIILAVGAQGYLLDIEGGHWPSVSSSHVGVAGAISGLGVSHKQIARVYGVMKLVHSHVGGESDPLVTEIEESQASQIRGEVGGLDSERGSKTGRDRRLGNPDLVVVKNSLEENGADGLIINKLDWGPKLGDTIPVAIGYSLDGEIIDRLPASLEDLARCQPEYRHFPAWDRDISHVRKFSDLPRKARALVKFIEEYTGCEVIQVGVGPLPYEVIR